jgi:hypothetical protein
MIDKKERKRDVAVFANMLKDIMNDPTQDPLVTLDRDLQHFIYGRVAVLVKHNENKAIGGVGDMGAVVGAAFADVLKEFVKNKLDEEQVQRAFDNAREHLLRGFDVRAPKFEIKEQADKEEAAVE